MVLITQRKKVKQVRELCKRNGLDLMLGLLGKGTAESEILHYLGLEASENAVMLYFVTDETWKRLKKCLTSEFQIEVPGRGVAFIIPFSSIGGGRLLEMLTDGQNYVKEEESVMKDTKYELIVAIANHGYSEEVMDAARNGGARGGTVIHARGTGFEKAERFLGVLIADDKALIMIVSKKEDKNRIMKAVMEQAGTASKAGAVVFSLPVTSVAGMQLQEFTEQLQGE